MEHFGFFYNRQILDVVGVAQECMHSIKIKDIQYFVLNMDLINVAYLLYLDSIMCDKEENLFFMRCCYKMNQSY